MRQVSKMDLVVVAVLGLVLFALAITLVNVQYRARTLFVEHERAVDVGRRLADDEAHIFSRSARRRFPEASLTARVRSDSRWPEARIR